ncbi:unnamed protein product, partial [Trichobilharzia szidati]
EKNKYVEKGEIRDYVNPKLPKMTDELVAVIANATKNSHSGALPSDAYYKTVLEREFHRLRKTIKDNRGVDRLIREVQQYLDDVCTESTVEVERFKCRAEFLEQFLVIDGLWLCDSARATQAFLNLDVDDETLGKGKSKDRNCISSGQFERFSRWTKTLGTNQPIRGLMNASVARRQMLPY